MSKLSKRVKAAKYMQENEALFKCPVCSSAMHVAELKSLVCSNNHTFDIARQGYLHLLAGEAHTKYSRDLFVAREKVVMQSDFFNPLVEQVSDMITKHSSTNNPLTIADMGCGEGSLLHLIKENVQDHTNTTIGLDIARAGILEATKNYEQIIWLIADLANPPLKNESVDVILNILSPSNYKAFNEVLADDGLVLKVIPRNDYLRELREYFNRQRQEDTGEKIVTQFEKHFNVVDRVTVEYEKKLSPAILKALVQMTPLTWGIKQNKIEQFLQSKNQSITVDLDVIIGQR